jgi:hypothetical protein
MPGSDTPHLHQTVTNHHEQDGISSLKLNHIANFEPQSTIGFQSRSRVVAE